MVSVIALQPLTSSMSENAPQLERDRQRDQQRAGHGADSEHEGPFQFQMIQRGDFIRAGWWHWRCRREDGAGEVDYGYVQADALGRVVAPETFEKDRRYD
jgi:hypothetical protein